jgi:GT2 family glycosyltransferase
MELVQYHPAVGRPANPLCSICIANFNGATLLDDCLESVLAQSGDISIEIIIHDDASTDDSVELLRNKYPQVELLVSRINVGFCIGNNRMVEHARGKYVLLLNNDAALFPDALLTLLNTANKEVPAGVLTLPQYDWTTGALVDRGCLLDPFYNPVPNLDPARREVAMAIGACLFLSRSLWNELGGFPEWFESIGEDLYLCCLARLRGALVQVTTRSGYRHRQGVSFGGNRAASNGLQTTFRRRRLSERNKTSAMVVCTPTLFVWPLLTLHVISLIVEGAVMTMLRRTPRIWREIYKPTLKFLFHDMSYLRARRKQEQALSQITLKVYLHDFVALPHKLRLLRRHGIPRIR